MMKSIFLVNPFSGQGHLDAYARLYSRAFLELGYKVTLVAATDGGTSAYLERNAVDRACFSFSSFSAMPPPKASGAADANEDLSRADLSSIQRARLVWDEEGAIGMLRRLVVVPRRVIRRLVPDPVRDGSRRIRRTIAMQLARVRAMRILRRFFFPDAGRIHFTALMDHVHNAVSILGGEPPDLVFIMYLDLMAEGKSEVAALNAAGHLPWAGILFHPRLRESSKTPIERYFETASARGGVFLVPETVDTYARATPRLKFLLVPDVADLERSIVLPSVAEQIRKKAAGRTIVLQVGTIAPHKGILTLINVIAKADPQRFFFAMIGEVYWQSFGDDEGRLRNFYAQSPDNVMTYDAYVTEERDYNSLVAACDVIYAVYSGFNSSSNSLSKAAGLRRPILAAKNSLMGDRVQAHGIGLAVANDDVDEILKALECLRTDKDSFQFDGYASHHSLEELKTTLANGLPCWLDDSGSPDVKRSATGPSPLLAKCIE
jgi:glycosyltransferase involved in cell wall biosynthesis